MESIVIVAAESDTSGIGDWLWARLKSAGFKVWWGEYDLRVGIVVLEGMEQAILEHSTTLLILNQPTIASHLGKFQSDLALHRGRRIVPIIVDDSKWPERFQMMRSMRMQGPNDWQSLHRLVNDLGGEHIPRLVNLSGHTDLPVINALILGAAEFRKTELTDSDTIAQYGIDLARFAIPFIRKARAGIVPPGLASAACITLAYLLGTEGGLPPIYPTHRDNDGRFQADGLKPLYLQTIRDMGFSDRSSL